MLNTEIVPLSFEPRGPSGRSDNGTPIARELIIVVTNVHDHPRSPIHKGHLIGLFSKGAGSQLETQDRG